MIQKVLSLLAGLTLILATQFATAAENEFLVKMSSGSSFASQAQLTMQLPHGTQVEDLGGLGWYLVKAKSENAQKMSIKSFKQMRGVSMAQPNFKIKLLENPSLAAARAQIQKLVDEGVLDEECPIPGMCGEQSMKDNPEIPAVRAPSTGNDPLFTSQWGMNDIGASQAWNKSKGSSQVVVAVLDTGIDYTHEDLVENLWRNPGETGTDSNGQNKSSNGIDDDNNGYVDDVIGWDMVSDDNKPFDLAKTGIDIMFGGNPGHGTHCAGNVAARGFNGKGISGVAPHVSIMTLRFLSEKGEGTTAGAVKAILYAINNGAHITSNSWGSVGEDPNDPDNPALREAIRLSEQKGVLFVAAAGNGLPSTGQGYDNDSSPGPAYPASYPDDIILSVAALDSSDNLGSFSNWGLKSVDIGAPGVKVFSTTVLGKYSDMVIDLEGIGLKVSWDGTSMATPHVAGAAALYLSQKPNASWKEIKDAILRSAKPVSSMNGKSVSGGKLNLDTLF